MFKPFRVPRSIPRALILSPVLLIFASSSALGQFPLFQRSPYLVEKSQFDQAIMGQGNSQELVNRLTALEYETARYDATIQAGSPVGVPADTPVDRIDPNTADSPFAGVGSLEITHPTLGNFCLHCCYDHRQSHSYGSPLLRP